jgi:hypothetical protein
MVALVIVAVGIATSALVRSTRVEIFHTGTGFVATDDGRIVTNRHASEPANINLNPGTGSGSPDRPSG